MFCFCSCDPAGSTYLSRSPEGPVMGFDLRKDTIDLPTGLEIVKRIRANGGNYLRLSESFTGKERQTLRVAADRAGVFLDTTDELTRKLLVSNIPEFNRRMLESGSGGIYGELSQARLNSIRAVRTVERYYDFTRLRRDDRLLGRANPSGAVAAADSLGNYLIYIPRSGKVTVRLPERDQVPRRVTVIGHLGTQRSEILRPPYDREFSLLSNDARGGWMVIKREP
ncbi:hypothetical protein [Lewinella sp. JB7]|uniref:hypothetical protein n=1 Tax=Lewinella sp. JB7 TaxID=2962887 RepID=UPI0020C9BD0E|nr:hypothetical protein [Lewinella sp. JB7]MCP9235305.1 hypothetical protein [Lewinella sp. JB7]